MPHKMYLKFNKTRHITVINEESRLRIDAEPFQMTFVINDDCIGCGTCSGKCPANAINGEIKARFCIDPLLCTECGTCFNTCPIGAVIDPQGNRSTRKSRNRKKPLKSRINSDLCAGCRTCFLNCPQKAITVIKKGLFSRFYCRVDTKMCVGCGTCTKYCITGAAELR